MTFPSLVGTVAQTLGTTATTTPVVNLPSGMQAGELISVLIRVAVAGAIGFPAGWVRTINDASDASDDQTALAFHFCDGTEGSTITLSSASGKFSALAWRVADTKGIPEFATLVTGTSTTPDPGTITPTGGARDYLFVWVGGWEGEQTSPPAAAPSGYSGLAGADSGTAGAITTNTRVAIAWKQANASSEDPGSITISASDDWTATVLCYHPIPGLRAPVAPVRALGPRSVVRAVDQSMDGKAIRLTAQSHYIDFGSASALDNLTSLTVAMLWKCPSTPIASPMGQIVNKRNTGAGTNGWAVQVRGTGELWIRWAGSTALDYITKEVVFRPGVWTWAVVSIDQAGAAGDRVQVYFRAHGGPIQLATFTNTVDGTGFATDASETLRLGSAGDNSSGAAGDHGFMALFSKLTQSQIYELLDDALPFRAMAKVFVRPGQRGMARVVDESGNGNEGTITGGTAVNGIRRLWAFPDVPTPKRPTLTAILSGALTPTGGLLKQVNLLLSGGFTPAGALMRSPSKLLTGTLTPSGALLKQARLLFAGGITPSGTLTLLKLFTVSLAGALTPAATLLRQISKLVTGALTPAGTLNKRPSTLLSGALTASGTLIKQDSHLMAGAVVPTGELLRQVRLLFAGALTPLGTLATLKLVLRAFAGTLTLAGDVITSVILSGVRLALRFVDRGLARLRFTDRGVGRRRIVDRGEGRFRIDDHSEPD
jgi:hypothetical protein